MATLRSIFRKKKQKLYADIAARHNRRGLRSLPLPEALELKKETPTAWPRTRKRKKGSCLGWRCPRRRRSGGSGPISMRRSTWVPRYLRTTEPEAVRAFTDEDREGSRSSSLEE